MSILLVRRNPDDWFGTFFVGFFVAWRNRDDLLFGILFGELLLYLRIKWSCWPIRGRHLWQRIRFGCISASVVVTIFKNFEITLWPWAWWFLEIVLWAAEIVVVVAELEITWWAPWASRCRCHGEVVYYLVGWIVGFSWVHVVEVLALWTLSLWTALCFIWTDVQGARSTSVQRLNSLKLRFATCWKQIKFFFKQLESLSEWEKLSDSQKLESLLEWEKFLWFNRRNEKSVPTSLCYQCFERKSFLLNSENQITVTLFLRCLQFFKCLYSFFCCLLYIFLSLILVHFNS